MSQSLNILDSRKDDVLWEQWGWDGGAGIQGKHRQMHS